MELFVISLLILLGVVLLSVEIALIPGVGITGIMGVLSLISAICAPTLWRTFLSVLCAMRATMSSAS